MSRTFTLEEVNALELSAADNATVLERERIIKLLEEHDAAIIRDNLIALIKGENK